MNKTVLARAISFTHSAVNVSRPKPILHQIDTDSAPLFGWAKRKLIEFTLLIESKNFNLFAFVGGIGVPILCFVIVQVLAKVYQPSAKAIYRFLSLSFSPFEIM